MELPRLLPASALHSDLAGRRDADDPGAGATVRTFEVEAGWGGGWHRAGRLAFAAVPPG
ncbi:hypothetical protein [Catenuloplanes indicus]|uniref:Uncharacterized protein n=1 Tax=Catenuloplanes indicus TaxID=137267 RepID=A0AAE4B2Q9_9ACTN|nr:hypothetical protein [Catenuloplanes indicus]MDQ0370951.1 hypothetical protein [Catenuloplanes indicus]